MPRRDLISLFILALLFNGLIASFIQEPGGVDDAYYFGGALRLVQGQGFTEPYLWNYLGNPAAIPLPSHLYWMPLTSIVEAGGMALLGQNFNAARIPLVWFASLLPLVSYAVAWKTTGLRRHALGAALLTIFCGYFANYWGTTDSFALFGLIVGLTLFALGTWSGDWKQSLLIGLGAGLAHLTRADGLLLLVVALLILLIAVKQLSGASPQLFICHLSFVILGYLLPMLPWFIRNLMVAGNPLGSGGAGTIWMLEYNDLFNYPSNLTPARYFAAGWPLILSSKWEAVVTNLQHIIAEQGLIFLTPFILIGLWRLRRQALFRPVLLYAALLYFVMTFVFSFPGMRGGLFHSGVALLPFYFTACFVGLDAVVDWVAARLRHWQPERAKPNFSVLLILGAATLTAFIILPGLTRRNGAGATFRALTSDLPVEAVVMSNNPPALWIATGHPGLPPVNGDVSNLLAAADYYGVDYVLLDTNVPAGLLSLYQTGQGERLKLVKTIDDWKLFEVLP